MSSPYRTVQHDGVDDAVAIEEPLEIRVDGQALAVTMRTPGHDEQLALGFLLTEGLISEVREAGPTEDFAGNIVEVAGPLLRDPGTRRFYTTSSCGVCGKGALEEVAVLARRCRSRSRWWSVRSWRGCPSCSSSPGSSGPGAARNRPLRRATASCWPPHEDVGRHNAMDKVIGEALQRGWVPLYGHILCVSGRLSFELVQKAAVAGAPILVGVGAPSSLAVEVADDRGMTLCGFARRGRLNVYTHPGRVR